MAQNRIMPYGYKIENGKLIIEPQEEKVVVKIFKKYAEGESYKSIAEMLTGLDIRYMPQKAQWNKNMVARILQNKNYLGNEKYPAIIPNELYQTVKKEKKPYNHTQSEDIKVLKSFLICGECGEKLKRRLKVSGEERWYCPNDKEHISLEVTDENILDSILILQQKLAEETRPQEVKELNDQANITKLNKLKNEIELEINETNPDYKSIKEKIMLLACEKYKGLEVLIQEDIEVYHIIGQLSKKEISSGLLKEVLKKITISHAKAVEFQLKNGQKISI